MGYACPVCDTSRRDEAHPTNHLASQAIIHGDDHEAWLDEHASEWADLNADPFGPLVADLAEEREFDEVFEDTIDRTGGSGHAHPHGQEHDHNIPDRQPQPFGGASGSESLSGDTACIFEEAQSLTCEMVADSGEDDENGECEDVPRNDDDTRDATNANNRGEETDGANRKKSQVRTPNQLAMGTHGTIAPASLGKAGAAFDRAEPTTQMVVREVARAMEFDREEYSERVIGDIIETVRNTLFAESLSVTVGTRTEFDDWRSTHEGYMAVELDNPDIECVAWHAVPFAEMVLATTFQNEEDAAASTPRHSAFGHVYHDALLREGAGGDNDASAGANDDAATDAAGTDDDATGAGR